MKTDWQKTIDWFNRGLRQWWELVDENVSWSITRTPASPHLTLHPERNHMFEKLKENKTCVGDSVRDNITGFNGIIISRTEYLHGCVRCCVQPVELKDGTPQKSYVFDEPQLESVKMNVVAVGDRRTGGDRPINER